MLLLLLHKYLLETTASMAAQAVSQLLCSAVHTLHSVLDSQGT
jgi:hypothetical protein